MDAKLKALKVVDLKAVLAKAGVAAPAKATKNDLIARIQASKEALAAYAELYPQDDLLAPPEEVDWNVDDTPAETKEAAAPVQEPAAASAPAAPTPASPAKTAPATTTDVPVVAETAATSTPSEDPELEKRRQRAARFGIPLVEPRQKKSAGKTAPPPDADPKKLEERARRFGMPTAATATAPASNAKANGKKRPASQAEDVDPEELERRKKRAERFGINSKA